MRTVGRSKWWLATLWLGIGTHLSSQAPDQVTVPFSNPSREGTITVRLVQGRISVQSANRKDVLIVARPRAETLSRRATMEANGLRRLPSRPGFQVEEDFNEMSISSLNPNQAIDFEIQTPTRSNLRLSTVNGGDILVTGIAGNLEIGNTNGSITLEGVSGSVVANTTNGNLLATLMRVTPEKAMAFTSLNGRVDVTLPSSTKANLKLRSDNGGVYTDFEVALKPPPPPLVRDAPTRGRYQIIANKSIYGSINGGGPDIELRSFSSNVYVRKGK